jgi:hypothetical protein
MENVITRGNYSEGLWNEHDTKEVWDRFQAHDWDALSRQMACQFIRSYLKRKRKAYDFAEVGFGGAYDFRVCFKALHDAGKIHYTGWDITPQFVRYASEEYPGYDWRVGGFANLEPGGYDITYTRHTLQHVSPDVYDDCLRALLRATRKLCLIGWRMPPADEEHIASDYRSWQNTWGRERTHRIIEEEGFSLEIVEFNDPDGENIYVLRRR